MRLDFELPFVLVLGAGDAQPSTVEGTFRGITYRLLFNAPDSNSVQLGAGGFGRIWTCDKVAIDVECSSRQCQDDAVRAGRDILNQYIEAIRYQTGQLQAHVLTSAQWDYARRSLVGIDEREWHRVIHLPKAGAALLLPIRSPYTIFNIQDVQDFVDSGRETLLEERILCDAYGFLRQNDIRRAVLEAAIASEVMIKRYVSEKGGSLASLIAEQHGLGFATVQFFDKVLGAIGEASLKDTEPTRYKELERLFEVRNQIAHTGLCRFKSRSGKNWHEVDAQSASVLLETVQWTFEKLIGLEIASEASVLNVGSERWGGS